MLQQTLPESTRPSSPMRRLHLLIEDPTLAGARLSDEWRGGMDVTICSGPTSDRDVCPLVLDGRCPLGPVDVVVCGLNGPWARSVHAAWLETPLLVVDAREGIGGSPPERFKHHMGTALAAMISPALRIGTFGTTGRRPSEQ
jgi:hypothetical protein